MSDTALRLADRLDLWGDQGDLLEAAAELRRLHAKCEALTADTLEEMDRITEIHRLRALNAELVEALRVAVDSDLGAKWVWHESGKEAWVNNARAALAKVEANNGS